MGSSATEPSIAPLAPGLYVVATPIGAARDVTLRALDIMRDADILAAEDTRNTRKLLDIHGIARRGPIVSYHDHNGAAQRPRLLRALEDGQSVALVSDAGTPLIADPGYKLVEAAAAAGHAVRAAPGASAVLAALGVAGLPTDRFLFAGFPPPKAAAREAMLREVGGVAATLVFYEAPRRLGACLAAMAATLGAERPAVVCRELTKRFEETWRGSLGELAARAAAGPPPRGEIVIVVGRGAPPEAGGDDIDAALMNALADRSVREAAREVAEALGVPRREVYARALTLSRAR